MTRTRASVRTFALLGLVSALLLVGSGPIAAEGADPKKQALVRELIAATGTDRIGPQIMDALIQQFRQVYRDVPPAYWQDLRSTINEDELRDRIVPIYAERFSESELNELLAFYRSTVGKKLVGELPDLTQRSVAVGQEWAKQQTNKLLEKLKADGYKPAQQQ